MNYREQIEDVYKQTNTIMEKTPEECKTMLQTLLNSCDISLKNVEKGDDIGKKISDSMAVICYRITTIPEEIFRAQCCGMMKKKEGELIALHWDELADEMNDWVVMIDKSQPVPA